MRSSLPRVLSLAVLAIASLGLAAPVRAADRLSVQMAFYPQGPQAYLFVAQEKGWFKEAGLDVEILDGRGSNYSMQVVSGGHADIGEGQLAPLASARDKGAKVKIIAEWFKKDGPAVIVPEDSNMRTPADLKGKKAVLIASGPWPPILDPFFKLFNMTQQDVSLVYVDATSLFTTYATGKVDAMLTVDLAYSEAHPMRPSRLMSAADFGVKLPGNGLFVTEDTLAKKRDALIRFVRVAQRAIDYTYDGHEEEAAQAIRMMRPDAKLGAERLLSQIHMFGPLRPSPSTEGKPVGWQSDEDWIERIAFLKEAKMIREVHTPRDFFNNEIVEEASKK
jgi:NitT/TauT family transport system substrate-binding protein